MAFRSHGRAASDSRIAGAPAAQTPMIRVSGDACASQAPIPPRSAPLPNGTIAAAMGSRQWQQLHRDRAGAFGDGGFAPVLDEHHAVTLLAVRARVRLGVVEVTAGKVDGGAELAHARDLERVRRLGREDVEPDAAGASGPGESLPEVPGRCGHQTVRRWAEAAKEEVGPASLE